MCETISKETEVMEPAGIVELGTASEQTRGSFSSVFLLDGFLNFPYIFVYQ